MAGYLGNIPSAVPLTSADIADGIITSAKIVDGTIVNADINASSAIALSKLSTTGTADATTFLRGDGAYTAVSSDFVRLSTSTITANTASVTFDGFFSSTYDTYIIYGNNILFDAGGNLLVRYRVSGSDVTANNYFSIGAIDTSDNSSSREVGHPTTAPQLNGNTPSNGSDYGMNFCITIFDPNNNQGTRYKHTKFELIYTTSTGYVQSSFGGFVNTNSTSALSGFKIYTNSGNFDAGTMVLYGVKK